MAVYENVKIFDYYEVNRAAKDELKAEEMLEFILNEHDIALSSGNVVVGYVREKHQVGRTIRATIWVSPSYLSRTAAENYCIKEYEVIRGAGGDMVCLHIEPLGEELTLWDKIKNKFKKIPPKIDGAEPSPSYK